MAQHIVLAALIMASIVGGLRIETMKSVAVTLGDAFELTCKTDLTRTDPDEYCILQMQKGGEWCNIENTHINNAISELSSCWPTRRKYAGEYLGLDKHSFKLTFRNATFDDARWFRCILHKNTSVTENTTVVVIRTPMMITNPYYTKGYRAFVCGTQYKLPANLVNDDKKPTLKIEVDGKTKDGYKSDNGSWIVHTVVMKLESHHNHGLLTCTASTKDPREYTGKAKEWRIHLSRSRPPWWVFGLVVSILGAIVVCYTVVWIITSIKKKQCALPEWCNKTQQTKRPYDAIPDPDQLLKVPPGTDDQEAYTAACEKAIDKMRSTLLKRIEPTPLLKAILIKKDVVTHSFAQNQMEKNRSDQISAIVDEVRNRLPTSFEPFCKCLEEREISMVDLAEELRTMRRKWFPGQPPMASGTGLDHGAQDETAQ